jgi:2,4-dienoyl-CoA reductase-like NADH-dependent reductase (Old Yellow Enzyme family)
MPMTNTAALFKPFSLKSLSLPNRITMAPMTRSFSPDGVPGVDVAAYYKRRAVNAVGLIITEGTVVAHPAAANDPKVPRFHGDDALAGWKHVVDEVKSVGGKIMPQLWHTGILRRLGSEPHPEIKPIAPSGQTRPGKKVVEPMSERDIDDVIAAFAQGAADAQRLGFDGIEIHGAHGYLIDQFFWATTNERADRFGGNIVARTKFAAEIVKACRRATSAKFPIILRFSQWKQQDYDARLAPTIPELEKFLAPLTDAGVDIFHASNRRFWLPEFEGSAMNLAGWTKKITGRAVITVGSVGLDNDFISTFGKGSGKTDEHMARLIEMVEENEVDLVAVGRALLGDPEWVVKLRDARVGDMIAYSAESLKTLD